jgi:hypothetical protein
MKRVWLCLVFLVLGVAPASAAGPDGDWFILGGNGGCWTSDVTHPAARKLIERGRRGCPLNCVAITPSDQWITLVGGNEFDTSTGLHVSRKLTELWKNPDVNEYKCVAFTPQGGWVALVDENTYFAHNIPDDAVKKLNELAKAGVEIRSIAFPPSGGWVILEGSWGAAYRGIPADAAKKIDQLVAEKTRINCVAFNSHNDWVMLTAGNGIWTSNVRLPVVRVLLRLQARKIALKWVAFSPGEYPGEYMVVRQPTVRFKAKLTTDLLGAGKVQEWYVYGPVAPNFAGQDQTRTTLSYNSKLIEESSPLKRQLLLARVTDSPKGISPLLMVEGTLYSRRLCPRTTGVAAVPDLAPADFKNYTRASEHANYDNPFFQLWLDLHDLRRRKYERDITFARRVYSFIRHTFTYEYPSGDSHAMSVALRQTSDCGGLSCVMVAILRANGIPARMLLGRWAVSETPPDRITGEVYGQWHAKAEFFAKGVGWVPLDMAAAVTDRDRGEYAHFGNDAGDFITLFAGQDAEVDTFVGDRYTGIGFQGMWWWKKGGVGIVLNETWTVTKEPVKKE